MDFDEAIRAHSAWKMKLGTYLSKRDGSLKPADIQPDNRCPLGQWLYGEGAKFSKLVEYGTVKTEHARFHKAAADVVRRADAGQEVREDVAIGGKSEFAAASMATVRAIMALKAKA